jgi:RNA polymerase sigma-70 factor (ECF subfamily)
VATVVLGTSEGADDVVQQALERAWQAIARFDEERAFRPWLLRIVANAARNSRRSRGRFARLAVRAASQAGTGGNGAANPEDVVVADSERQRLVAVLNRLRADDRLIIALRHFEQLTEREIADVLDIRPGTVKSRLSRAMQRLRTAYDQAGAPAVEPDEEVTLDG